MGKQLIAETDMVYVPAEEAIYTHPDPHHFDEALGVELICLVEGRELPVYRTRTLSAEILNHPKAWVLDLGKVYSPRFRKFDHHQDPKLPSVCRLLLDHFYKTEKLCKDLYDELLPYFTVVSNIDCNGYDQFNGFQVNTLVKMTNYIDNGWEIARAIAKIVITGAKATVDAKMESDSIWQRAEVIEDGFIRICEAFPIHWKRYTEGNQWILHSNDSVKYPIIPTLDKLFLHNGRHLAKYDLLGHAQFAARVSLQTAKEAI
jgi:uncharacterized UPF0160 family protein